MSVEVGKIYKAPVGLVRVEEVNGEICTYTALEGRFQNMVGRIEITDIYELDKDLGGSVERPNTTTLTITFPLDKGALEGEFMADNGEVFKCKIERRF
jgi:hypothetical protein